MIHSLANVQWCVLWQQTDRFDSISIRSVPRVDELNAACCDAHGICDTGVPNRCDAKCALIFEPFYTACHQMLPLVRVFCLASLHIVAPPCTCKRDLMLSRVHCVCLDELRPDDNFKICKSERSMRKYSCGSIILCTRLCRL